MATFGDAQRFVLRFVAIAGALLLVYHLPFAADGGVAGFMHLCHRGYALAAGALVGLFDPGVVVDGAEIRGAFPVVVTRGCDAFEIKAPVLAAVVAFPAPWRARLSGAVAMLGAVIGVNVLRIASLSWAGRRSMSLFETLHLDVWPMVIVLFATAAFLVWARRQSGRSGETEGGDRAAGVA